MIYYDVDTREKGSLGQIKIKPYYEKVPVSKGGKKSKKRPEYLGCSSLDYLREEKTIDPNKQRLRVGIGNGKDTYFARALRDN